MLKNFWRKSSFLCLIVLDLFKPIRAAELNHVTVCARNRGARARQAVGEEGKEELPSYFSLFRNTRRLWTRATYVYSGPVLPIRCQPWNYVHWVFNIGIFRWPAWNYWRDVNVLCLVPCYGELLSKRYWISEHIRKWWFLGINAIWCQLVSISLMFISNMGWDC